MKSIVIGIHNLACYTYIVNGHACDLLKIKEEQNFTLKSTESVDSYIHGLTNSLQGKGYGGFSVLIIYFKPDRMRIALRIADSLCEKGCQYISVMAAAHVLVPACSEFLRTDNRCEVWEILNELYRVSCYKDDLSVSSYGSQTGKSVRSIGAEKLCFFSGAGKKDTEPNPSVDERERLKQAFHSIYKQFHSEADPLLDEIYSLMGIKDSIKSHRLLLKRLSFADALYRLPESERIKISDKELIELANKNNKRWGKNYSSLLGALGREADALINMYRMLHKNEFTGITRNEWKSISKEVIEYATLQMLGEHEPLQEIKDDIITRKLNIIWREYEQSHG